MKHAEFRKRVEALILEMDELHNELGKALPTMDGITADYLLEIGAFEASRLVLQDIACMQPPDEPEAPRITIVGG